MIKKILIGIVVLLVIIQFIRAAKNLPGEAYNDIRVLYRLPEDVKAVLEHSCNDCHSNKTIYPWYAEHQPVG